MKRLVLLIATCVAVACAEAPDIKTIDEKYEPTDEELYAACAELSGIGQYQIGKTTLSQVLRDKEYRKIKPYDFDRKPNYYNGHWGCDFWNTTGLSVGEQMDKSHFIEKDVKGKVKQLYNGIEFKVGELEFDKFDMAFLNDTLVCIWFFPKEKETVVEHYKEKYGNGRGKKYKYTYRLHHSNGEFTLKEDTDEQHTWENGIVVLNYKNVVWFRSEPGRHPNGNYDESFIIYSKKRYPVFEEILLGSAAKYDQQKTKSKGETLNTL